MTDIVTNFWSMGLTKSVHPYWRFAICTMQKTPKTNCAHRRADGWAAAVFSLMEVPPLRTILPYTFRRAGR